MSSVDFKPDDWASQLETFSHSFEESSPSARFSFYGQSGRKYEIGLEEIYAISQRVLSVTPTVTFMAKKIQEAIFGLNGTILFKASKDNDTTCDYRSKDGNYAEKYEWHKLLSTVKKLEESAI